MEAAAAILQIDQKRLMDTLQELDLDENERLISEWAMNAENLEFALVDRDSKEQKGDRDLYSAFSI